MPSMRHLLLTSCLLGTDVSASPAPYWTGCRGTIDNSIIPSIRNGENYTVNLILTTVALGGL
jgi:hypothetical protein